MYENYPTDPQELFALCVWREARGQSPDAIRGVAWSIMNRVRHPRWWGHDLKSVIMFPWQYSSMTDPHDPQLAKFPADGDAAYALCQQACEDAQTGPGPDPVSGATHYYDRSLDSHPPNWTKAPSSVHVIDIGAFRFWRVQ